MKERFGVGLVAAGAVGPALLLFSGLCIRYGWLPLRTAFDFFKWGGMAGAAVSVVALGFLIFSKRRRAAAVGLVLALTAFVPTYRFKARAESLPVIHDITTDTANPPAFKRALSLRGPDANPVEYGGPEIARQQERAYPDVRPLWLEETKEAAFARAAAAARGLGWEVTQEDAARGRLEAVDTTPFFGFKDDVVIRVTKAEGKARVDIRSLSRVGKSDVGANAARIRKFLARFR